MIDDVSKIVYLSKGGTMTLRNTDPGGCCGGSGCDCC